MTPRMMAHAYAIYTYADPLGWDVSIQDIADATGIANKWIGRILKQKGWQTRIRTSVMDYEAFYRE